MSAQYPKKIIFLVFLFSCILVSPAMAAVTLEQNVTFNSTTNTTYIIGANLTVDNASINQSIFNLTNSSGGFVMSATPSSGSLNVTVFQFNITYWKFNLTGSNTSANVNFTISNASASSSFHLKRNGTFFQAITTNSTGHMSFNYDGGLSNMSLELLSSFANGSSCTIGGECGSGFCVHNICRPASTYCGDNFCDTGEMCSRDCGEGASKGGAESSSTGGNGKISEPTKTPPQIERIPYIPSAPSTPSSLEKITQDTSQLTEEKRKGKVEGIFGKIAEKLAVIVEEPQLSILVIILAVTGIATFAYFLYAKENK